MDKSKIDIIYSRPVNEANEPDKNRLLETIIELKTDNLLDISKYYNEISELLSTFGLYKPETKTDEIIKEFNDYIINDFQDHIYDITLNNSRIYYR